MPEEYWLDDDLPLSTSELVINYIIWFAKCK